MFHVRVRELIRENVGVNLISNTTVATAGYEQLWMASNSKSRMFASLKSVSMVRTIGRGSTELEQYNIDYIANSKFWPQILLQDADPAGLGTAQQAIALAPNGMLIASTTYTRLGPLLHQDVLTQ